MLSPVMDPSDFTYKTTKAKSGHDTLVVTSHGRDTLLHSKVTPERESELFAGRFDPARYDVLISLGVGLGYHLLPLSDYLSGYTRIILIDRLGGIDAAIAENRLTSFLASSDRVSFVLGKSMEEVGESLSGMIDVDEIRGITVLEHPGSMRIFGDYYTGVKRFVEKLIDRMAGNRATQKAFGPLYLRNILKNARLLDRVRPVRDLFGSLEHYPGIIIASGPCLEREIPGIARFQDRFFIIAADSAVPVLYKSGISPDFVISIDPQPYVYEHFLGWERDRRTATVFSLSSNHSAIKSFGGYVFLNSHPLCQFASGVYRDAIGSVDSATGSVAGDAIELCRKCGLWPVGLAGLDFSFPEHKIYSRGTAYQKRYSLYFQNRVSTVEGFNCRYILGASGGVTLEGRHTRRSFIQYRRSIEELVASWDATGVYSMSDCGLPLSSVRTLGIERFVKEKCGPMLDKRGIVAPIHSASRLLSAEPLLSSLNDIIHGPLFDEILDASLGSHTRDDVKKKYRAMAGTLKKIKSL
jgi:hypothetical protein